MVVTSFHRRNTAPSMDRRSTDEPCAPYISGGAKRFTDGRGSLLDIKSLTPSLRGHCAHCRAGKCLSPLEAKRATERSTKYKYTPVRKASAKKFDSSAGLGFGFGY